MRGEIIKLFKGGANERYICIEDIEIPDIKWIALCAEDPQPIFYIYDTAASLKEAILKRDPKNAITTLYAIDIPDIWGIATSFTKQEREKVLLAWHLLYALIRHLLPSGVQNTTETGSHFEGKCWVSQC